VPLHLQAAEAIRIAGDLPQGLAPEQLRRVYSEQRMRLLPPAPDVAINEAFEIPGTEIPIPVRFYRASSHATPRPLLVYFHGGGWMLGSLELYDTICRRLAVKGDCGVLSVGYRLAPESPFPAAVLDAIDATRWCAANLKRLGANASMLAVGGDSAGGNLAAVVALSDQQSREFQLALQVLIYPVTDVSREQSSYSRNAAGYMLTAAAMRSFIQSYVPNLADRTDVRVSPLLCQDLAGLPRALTISAEYDPLVDENELYARRLSECGVDSKYVCFPGMIHPFFTLGGIIDAATEVEDLIANELRALVRSG
jgi:acetyl esterase